MSYISITLENGKELDRQLKKLSRDVAQKAVKNGVRAGLAPTLLAAKANAHALVGGTMGSLIAKFLEVAPFRKQKMHSYGEKVSLSPAGNSAFIHYTKGSKSSLKTGKTLGRRYYIPMAIEFGHLTPYTRRSLDKIMRRLRKSTGAKNVRNTVNAGLKGTRYHVPAIPFMRSAADSNLNKGIRIFERYIKKTIEAA